MISVTRLSVVLASLICTLLSNGFGSAYAAPTDTSSLACNKFNLYTTKNYTSVPYYYRFSTGVSTCSPKAGGIGAIPGAVLFEYKLKINPPEQPGYVDIRTINWDRAGRFKSHLQMVYVVSFQSLDHVGPNVTSVAGILRNYMLVPEYVGNGWGIFVPHVRNGVSYQWHVHANVFKGSEYQVLPGTARGQSFASGFTKVHMGS